MGQDAQAIWVELLDCFKDNMNRTIEINSFGPFNTHMKGKH